MRLGRLPNMWVFCAHAFLMCDVKVPPPVVWLFPEIGGFCVNMGTFCLGASSYVMQGCRHDALEQLLQPASPLFRLSFSSLLLWMGISDILSAPTTRPKIVRKID
jgi:hypothetical protein